MDRMGRGAMLAGRYRLLERVHTDPVSALWRAEDVTLERPAAVHVLAPGHAHVDAALDAARRAAVVDDPRLQRVLGVGVEGGSGYVILEWVEGPSVADLAGRVPGGEALRIASDVAGALASAHARGLRHGALSPGHVRRGADGRVRVLGLAVDAAVIGRATSTADTETPDTDVTDAVAVLYALTTGRWPFGFVEGLLGAPRQNGRPVPVRELMPSAPLEVEEVCLRTFAGDPPAGPAVLEALLREVLEREAPAVARRGTGVGDTNPVPVVRLAPAPPPPPAPLLPVAGAGSGAVGAAGVLAGAAAAAGGAPGPGSARTEASGTPAPGPLGDDEVTRRMPDPFPVVPAAGGAPGSGGPVGAPAPGGGDDPDATEVTGLPPAALYRPGTTAPYPVPPRSDVADEDDPGLRTVVLPLPEAPAPPRVVDLTAAEAAAGPQASATTPAGPGPVPAVPPGPGASGAGGQVPPERSSPVGGASAVPGAPAGAGDAAVGSGAAVGAGVGAGGGRDMGPGARADAPGPSGSTAAAGPPGDAGVGPGAHDGGIDTSTAGHAAGDRAGDDDGARPGDRAGGRAGDRPSDDAETGAGTGALAGAASAAGAGAGATLVGVPGPGTDPDRRPLVAEGRDAMPFPEPAGPPPRRPGGPAEDGPFAAPPPERVTGVPAAAPAAADERPATPAPPPERPTAPEDPPTAPLTTLPAAPLARPATTAATAPVTTPPGASAAGGPAPAPPPPPDGRAGTSPAGAPPPAPVPPPPVFEAPRPAPPVPAPAALADDAAAVPAGAPLTVLPRPSRLRGGVALPQALAGHTRPSQLRRPEGPGRRPPRGPWTADPDDGWSLLPGQSQAPEDLDRYPDWDRTTPPVPVDPDEAPYGDGRYRWYPEDDEEYEDDAAGRRRRGVVGVVVVLALVAVVLGVGAWALSRAGIPGIAGSAAEPTVTTTVAASASASAGAPAESATQAPPAAVAFAGVRALDPPPGDGAESDAEAPRAIDGDPATVWASEGYNSAAFGGLKDGVGLLLSLNAPTAVSTITLQAPGAGGAFEIRSATQPAFEGSTVLATGETSDAGPVTVTFETVQTPYVVVWFTSLPAGTDGRFRATVAEVQLA